MPRFVVRLGYDWVTHCYREVEVDAEGTNQAAEIALALSKSEPEFWNEAIDCDGEATDSEILDVGEVQAQNRPI